MHILEKYHSSGVWFELVKHVKQNKPHIKTEKGDEGKIIQSHSDKGVCQRDIPSGLEIPSGWKL